MKQSVTSSGFTIIEVLIATAIFSVLLLVCTFALIQVGHVYYKAQTESSVQNVARSVIDTLAQDIEFSAGAVAIPPLSAFNTSINGGSANTSGFAICTEGSIKRYSVLLGHELENSPSATQTKHVIVVDTPGFCTPGSAGQLPMSGGSFILPGTGNPHELLAPNMRLAFLTITQPLVDFYKIHIRVVYGDDDLLSDKLTLNAQGEPVSGTDGVLDTCSLNAGSQFCSTADLTTYVQKRVP